MEMTTVRNNNLQITNTTLSRKARRQASKIVTSTTKTSSPSKRIITRPVTEDFARYECCICGDDCTVAEGIIPCTEHFLCNECIVDSFNTALRDMEAFPAKCCAPLPRKLADHLLSPEVIEAYKWKAKEYYTKSALRVYCHKEDCRTFLPDTKFDNSDDMFTIAWCDCEAGTCVGCKEKCEGDDHRCSSSSEPGGKPDWLPEYSDSCRIKQCPGCRMWMEHQEACNHMTCSHLQHQFCFICMQPWSVEEGFHEATGCPSYKDPSAGYDEEGFEQTPRGIHCDTGYDRRGFTRLGHLDIGRIIHDGHEEPYQQGAQDGIDNARHHWDERDWANEDVPEVNFDDQDFHEENGDLAEIEPDYDWANDSDGYVDDENMEMRQDGLIDPAEGEDFRLVIEARHPGEHLIYEFTPASMWDVWAEPDRTFEEPEVE